MTKKFSILRGLGLLFVFILVVFTGVFFYAYITGGDSKALSLFPVTVSAFCKSMARSTTLGACSSS